MKHDRLPTAPVLIEDLDAVFGSDRIHVKPSKVSRVRFAPFGLCSESARLDAPLGAARYDPAYLSSEVQFLQSWRNPPRVCMQLLSLIARRSPSRTQSTKVPASS